MKTMLKAAMLTAGLFVASAGALVAQDAPAVPDFAAPAAAPAAPAAGLLTGNQHSTMGSTLSGQVFQIIIGGAGCLQPVKLLPPGITGGQQR